MATGLDSLGPFVLLVILALCITLAVFLILLPFFVYGIWARSIQVSAQLALISSKLDLLVKNTHIAADFFKAKLDAHRENRN